MLSVTSSVNNVNCYSDELFDKPVVKMMLVKLECVRNIRILKSLQLGNSRHNYRNIKTISLSDVWCIISVG